MVLMMVMVRGSSWSKVILKGVIGDEFGIDNFNPDGFDDDDDDANDGDGEVDDFDLEYDDDSMDDDMDGIIDVVSSPMDPLDDLNESSSQINNVVSRDNLLQLDIIKLRQQYRLRISSTTLNNDWSKEEIVNEILSGGSGNSGNGNNSGNVENMTEKELFGDDNSEINDDINDDIDNENDIQMEDDMV